MNDRTDKVAKWLRENQAVYAQSRKIFDKMPRISIQCCDGDMLEFGPTYRGTLQIHRGELDRDEALKLADWIKENFE